MASKSKPAPAVRPRRPAPAPEVRMFCIHSAPGYCNLCRPPWAAKAAAAGVAK